LEASISNVLSDVFQNEAPCFNILAADRQPEPEDNASIMQGQQQHVNLVFGAEGTVNLFQNTTTSPGAVPVFFPTQ
jgi:hypothetical protein